MCEITGDRRATGSFCWGAGSGGDWCEISALLLTIEAGSLSGAREAGLK